jgi:dUTP pyrophosphatase
MKTLYVYVEDKELRNKYSSMIETRNEDSGFDVFNPEKINMDKTTKVNFKIKCAMMDENRNSLPYYLYLRSSMSKTNIRLANSVGIIDKGYRGDICAYFDVLGKDTLKLYQRPIQLCANDLSFFNVVLVDDFESFAHTLRGEQGFGSTGI